MPGLAEHEPDEFIVDTLTGTINKVGPRAPAQKCTRTPETGLRARDIVTAPSTFLFSRACARDTPSQHRPGF
jgi:hypothetical protein